MKKVNIRQFRANLSTLKKQGLIPSTVKVRSAKPTDKVGRTKLTTLINKFDDVVSGKLTAVKVSPKKFTEYKRNAEYRTYKDRVLVPHSAVEKVKVTRGGNISITNPQGLERIQIPVKFENLEQYLTDIERQGKTLDKRKRGNQYFGFRFHGNNSSRLYRNIDLAIEDLRNYQSVQQAINSRDEKEIYQNLQFVRVNRIKDWTFPSEKKRQQSAERNRRRRAEFRERLPNMPESVQQKYREQNAARQAEYRKRLNKGQKKAYKKAAKERRKISDARRNPKKP